MCSITGELTLRCTQCGNVANVFITSSSDLNIVDLVNSVGWTVDEDDNDILYCDNHEVIGIIEE